MSAIVRFEEPPGARSGTTGRDWNAVAAALKKKPQRWAIVAVCPTAVLAASTAQNIRKGTVAAMRPVGAFEAVSRTVDGEPRVYARYVGEPS